MGVTQGVKHCNTLKGTVTLGVTLYIWLFDRPLCPLMGVTHRNTLKGTVTLGVTLYIWLFDRPLCSLVGVTQGVTHCNTL